jgi:hypothetical protein
MTGSCDSKAFFLPFVMLTSWSFLIATGLALIWTTREAAPLSNRARLLLSLGIAIPIIGASVLLIVFDTDALNHLISGWRESPMSLLPIAALLLPALAALFLLRTESK